MLIRRQDRLYEFKRSSGMETESNTLLSTQR